MFRIPTFWGIQDVKETNFLKGFEVIQEWDGFQVSEESEKLNFRKVPRLFRNEMNSKFPGFQRVLRSFRNEYSQISTVPVGHCSCIGPYLLVYLLVVASSSVFPSQKIKLIWWPHASSKSEREDRRERKELAGRRWDNHMGRKSLHTERQETQGESDMPPSWHCWNRTPRKVSRWWNSFYAITGGRGYMETSGHMWMDAVSANRQKHFPQSQEGRCPPMKFQKEFGSIFWWTSSCNYHQAQVMIQWW